MRFPGQDSDRTAYFMKQQFQLLHIAPREAEIIRPVVFPQLLVWGQQEMTLSQRRLDWERRGELPCSGPEL